MEKDSHKTTEKILEPGGPEQTDTNESYREWRMEQICDRNWDASIGDGRGSFFEMNVAKWRSRIEGNAIRAS